MGREVFVSGPELPLKTRLDQVTGAPHTSLGGSEYAVISYDVATDILENNETQNPVAERVPRHMLARPSRVRLASLAVVIVLAAMSAQVELVSAQGIPTFTSALYTGSATAGGSPVPDGFTIVAKIGTYQSQPVKVKAGGYNSLMVSPTDVGSAAGKKVTFHLDGVQANQTDTFTSGRFRLRWLLTFPTLPAPTPTPSPTPRSEERL